MKNSKSPTVYLIGLIVLIFAFVNTASAISFHRKSQNQNRNVHESVTEYPWTFQVTFDDNIRNDHQHGASLFLKKQFDRNWAARIGGGLFGHESAFNYREVHHPDGRVSIYNDGRDFDVTGGFMNLQFMHNPGSRRGINFFWGLGPRLELREPDFDKYYIYSSDSPEYYQEIDKDNSTMLGLGLEGTLGLEWFLNPYFSILAEYGATLQNEWVLYTTEYYDHHGDIVEEVDSIDDGTSFKADMVKLGVAFHF